MVGCLFGMRVFEHFPMKHQCTQPKDNWQYDTQNLSPHNTKLSGSLAPTYSVCVYRFTGYL